MAKTEDEVKEELAISLAKSILESGVSSRDNLVKATSIISTIAIPSYVGVLKVYEQSLKCVEVWIKMAPIVLWIGALLLCLYVLVPRDVMINFKDVPAIHDMHFSTIKRTRRYVLISSVLQILGLAVASWIVVVYA